MFEVVQVYLIELIKWIPGLLGLCLIFEFIGNLLFKK